jgi:2',3'-cyclic-nucleotide 2'-phosphodiesterase (5'-nucleotidase family)
MHTTALFRLRQGMLTPLAALGLLLTLPACQRGAYVPTARLAPTTSQPVGKALPDDPTAAALIKPYHDKVVSQMSEVLGTAPVAIGKGNGESPLVNFVGDVQRSGVAKTLGQPADLGVVTSGAVRAALPAGPITLGSVFELMPFENELVVLDAPAETVQQLFVFAAKVKLPISGATYTVGADGLPTDIRLGGQPFNPAANRRYTIATSDYLATGGDHLDFFRPLEPRHTGLLLRNVIADHIRTLGKAGRPVEAKVEGRVK